ncbi:unnamed protein product [Pleuronectes platessa]|uniref:Uncharacterized protein n=1 Tax=Pleuronectes platessa TaxID=8262 RepID=A0A9N7UQ02_PLEPL|nr:unnamed protein product [Pleuronectes platessa]
MSSPNGYHQDRVRLSQSLRTNQSSDPTVHHDENQLQVYSSLLHGDDCIYVSEETRWKEPEVIQRRHLTTLMKIHIPLQEAAVHSSPSFGSARLLWRSLWFGVAEFTFGPTASAPLKHPLIRSAADRWREIAPPGTCGSAISLIVSQLNVVLQLDSASAVETLALRGPAPSSADIGHHALDSSAVLA